MTSAPSRHSDIPQSAIWDEERGEFCDCPRNGAEQRHGDARWYHTDGTLACTCSYVEGESHGPYQRFHQNGEISQEGSMWHGKMHGEVRWTRSTADTTESTVPDSMDERLWSIRTSFEKGLAYPNQFFDREGERVCQTGDPCPPRPDSVEPRADFSVEEERWFFGLGAQGYDKRQGDWRWWTRDGVLVMHKEFEGAKEHRSRTFREDGTLEQETVSDASGKAMFVRCYDAEGNVVTSAGASLPPRPDAVPEGAVFDTTGNRWIAASSLQPGSLREGTWRWWAEGGLIRKEVEYVGGQARTTRDYFEDTGTLFHEVVEDAAGNETRNAYTFRDGSVNNSVDRVYVDGELSEVVLHDQWGLKAKSTRASEGMDAVFFSDGVQEAAGRVVDRRAVGTWTFVIDGQSHTEDLTEHGLRARIDDDDFEPTLLLGHARFEAAAATERAPQLKGVDEVDWKNITGCYNDEVDEFPSFLQAMTSPLSVVRQVALWKIAAEVLHQSSVYVATAEVVPFLVRLLAHPNASRLEILGFLNSLASAAIPYAHQALEWAEEDADDDDAKAILGTLGAVKDNFGELAGYIDENEGCRSYVLALAAYGGEAGRVVLQGATSGDEPVEASVAVDSLLQLDTTKPSDAEVFLEDDRALIRCVAACRAARVFGLQAPPQTETILLGFAEDGSAVREDFEGLPFVDEQLLAHLAMAVASLGNERAGDCVGLFARQFSTINFFNLELYTAALFSLCFGNGELPFAPSFLEFFDAVAACEQLDGFANFSSVARNWNMPTDRREYRALAESIRAADDPMQAMHARLHGEDE